MKSDQSDASDDFMTTIRQHLADWGSSARSRTDALADRLFAGTEGMSEEARRRIVEAREAALHAQLRAEAAVRRASKSLARTAQAQPLTIGAVALAAGAAFGAALPRSAREDQVLGAHRDECLNLHWFRSLRHAREEIARWRRHYNTERPHSALGYLSPTEFLIKANAPAPETLAVSALPLNTQTQPEDSGSPRP